MKNYQAWVQDDIAPFSNLKYKSIVYNIIKNRILYHMIKNQRKMNLFLFGVLFT